MNSARSYEESEFTVTRTQGLQGLRVKWEEKLVRPGLYVSTFLDPCMVNALGYLEVGDEIVSIDGRVAKSEADINFFTEHVATDLVTIRIRRESRAPSPADIEKKLGDRFNIQLRVIENLKTTFRKDSIEIGDAKLILANIALEAGSRKVGKENVEEAMQIAYATAAGINIVLAKSYLALAHIAYLQRKWPDTRRNLYDALDVLTKMRDSTERDLAIYDTALKMAAIAETQDSPEDKDFAKKKMDDVLPKLVSLVR